MTSLPVNAIGSGSQLTGYWTGTPALVIRLMENPEASVDPSVDRDAWPLTDWDFDPNNEISTSRLLGKSSQSTPHFAYFGASVLASLALSYREQHIIFVGREPCGHDLSSVIRLLREGGRQVQVETAGHAKQLPPVGHAVWVTLRALPMEDWGGIDPNVIARADEILVYARTKDDLDRAERLFGKLTTPVWLGPAPCAEPAVYFKCFNVACRHIGWRAFR